MYKVKICGMTRLEDALCAAENGVDALGFIFYKKSKRYISPENAKIITEQLPPFVSRVGVFVNEKIEEVLRIAKMVKLDYVQIHGDENKEYIDEISKEIKYIKALRVKDEGSLEKIKDLGLDTVLLDTYSNAEYGGTGEKFNWELAVKAKTYAKVILAGGLNLENIEQAMEKINPYAFDINSGIEDEPGKKNKEKIIEILKKLKG